MAINHHRSTTLLGFEEYLKLLPTPWVFEHFLNQTGSSRKILSSSGLGDRIKQFSHPDSLHKQFSSLDSDSQRTCALIYLLGETGFKVPEKTIDEANVLVASFLVYAARNESGELRFFGFNEFVTPLLVVLARTLADPGFVKDADAPALSRHSNAINDIAVIATLALQGVLEKKKQGGLMRNAVQKIGKLMHDPSNENTGVADVLIAYASHLDILGETEVRYHIVPEMVGSFLKRPHRELSDEIIDFSQSFAGAWRLSILQETLKQVHGQWLTCSLFPDHVREAAIRSLHILRWAGVIDMARTGNEWLFGPLRARMEISDRGMATQTPPGVLRILSDFAVVVSPDAGAEALYRFGCVGTLSTLDHVYKGAVDRAVLCDSLANGLSGDDICAWFTQWGAPPNVLATVREWIREFYRLYISEGSLLVSTDDKVSHQIASLAPLREYLEPLPSHALFRIRHGAEETVRELLAKMGFDHRMPDKDRSLPVHVDGEVSSAAAPVRWEPVVSDLAEPAPVSVINRCKKYGTTLKAVELNEMLHIIDYAIVTGTELVFEYAGSPLIKKGNYTVKPVACQKGTEPVLEAELKTGARRNFLLRKISTIGVGIA